jgi:hypothetical protein
VVYVTGPPRVGKDLFVRVFGEKICKKKGMYVTRHANLRWFPDYDPDEFPIIVWKDLVAFGELPKEVPIEQIWTFLEPEERTGDQKHGGVGLYNDAWIITSKRDPAAQANTLPPHEMAHKDQWYGRIDVVLRLENDGHGTLFIYDVTEEPGVEWSQAVSLIPPRKRVDLSMIPHAISYERLKDMDNRMREAKRAAIEAVADDSDEEEEEEEEDEEDVEEEMNEALGIIGHADAAAAVAALLDVTPVKRGKEERRQWDEEGEGEGEERPPTPLTAEQEMWKQRWLDEDHRRVWIRGTKTVAEQLEREEEPVRKPKRKEKEGKGPKVQKTTSWMYDQLHDSDPNVMERRLKDGEVVIVKDSEMSEEDN